MSIVLLSVPSYDGHMNCGLMHFLLEAGQSGHRVLPFPVTHRPTDVARNQAVAQAQRLGALLVFVDADAVPPQGAFAALVDKVQAQECVAGLPYCSSGGQICVGEHSPRVEEVEGLEGWQPVDNLGTHCVAYNVKVFEGLAKPYYYYEYSESGESLAGCAEDTVLHRRLRETGVPMFVNFSLWAGHLCPTIKDKPRSLTATERFLVRAGL